MSKIDNNYKYLCLSNTYNYMDKDKNISTSIQYMLNRSCMMFKYHNLPNDLTSIKIEKLLQSNGYAIFVKINDVYYVVNGGLGGELNVYNEPTIATVSIPFLNYNENLNIGNDCIVIKSDTFNMGLQPLISKYCYLMYENDITMNLETILNRLQVFLSADNNNTLESAKAFLKDIENGKLGVIAEEQMFSNLSVHNNSNVTKIKELYEYQQYLKGSLYNELGLNANYNMKRERLTNADIELNSDGLYPLIDNMLECRRNAIELINSMYGLDIEVELNSSWDYRMFNGKSIHDNELNSKSDNEEIETEEIETDNEEIETDDEEIETDDEEKRGDEYV